MLWDEFPETGGWTTTTGGAAASWITIGFDFSWTTLVWPGSTMTSGGVGAHPLIMAAAMDAARKAFV